MNVKIEFLISIFLLICSSSFAEIINGREYIYEEDDNSYSQAKSFCESLDFKYLEYYQGDTCACLLSWDGRMLRDGYMATKEKTGIWRFEKE